MGGIKEPKRPFVSYCSAEVKVKALIENEPVEISSCVIRNVCLFIYHCLGHTMVKGSHDMNKKWS